MKKICGREKELKILQKILYSENPEFLAVYGRRRIGKTYLIDRFFQDKGIYFHFTGVKGASTKEHLKLFSFALESRLVIDEKAPNIKTWIEGFNFLRKKISKIDNNKKIIIFFDELPWIDTPKSGFLKFLEHFWNDFFSRRPNSILIVCGSSAFWMIEKIIHNKGGLHNRLTATIHLETFNLGETEKFLEFKNIELNKKQIIDLYMVTGGVAQYLTYVERGQSVAQIIQNLCFKKNAPLMKEYHELFASLFDEHSEHLAIIEALANKRSGLTQSEVLKITKKSSGGSFSKILEELKEAGFIDFIPAFNKKKKDGKFFLVDEYSFFYLIWLKDFSNSNFQPLMEDYWLVMQGTAKYAVWSGFAFETLCRTHLSQIIKALNLQVVAINAVNWSYISKNNKDRGIQIDLIIDRRDGCMNICEIKFHNKELTFSFEDAKKIRFRREKFREVSKTKKVLFNTLISIYGAKNNSNFQEAFDNQVFIDDLFNTF